MPIFCEEQIRPIAQDEFHEIDYEIMEQAFDLHNELGRFCDENIYQEALACRCRDMGFERVAREVPIYVSCDGFEKTYFVDMLINGSVLYELKTVETIVGAHRAQALNYLLLLGLRHGKIVNMRPGSVGYSFVSTTLTPKQRFEFEIDDKDWRSLDEDSVWLRHEMETLLNEWGVFLDIDLYRDAIMHFRGGRENVLGSVKVVHNDRIVGSQKMTLLNEKTAFSLSAISEGLKHYESHLRRFVRHSELNAIQWINLNKHDVLFGTITA